MITAITSKTVRTVTFLKNGSVFYRANNNVSSGQTFNEDNWSEIGAALPLKGGVVVQKYKIYEPTTTTVTYGTEYKTVQEVANFLYGYSQYLETQGYVFDEFSKELDLPLNLDNFLKLCSKNWRHNFKRAKKNNLLLRI